MGINFCKTGFGGSGRGKCLGHPKDLDLMSRSKAQTLHEVRTDGEVDEMVMRSESRSDERFMQLSVLTKILLAMYTTIQTEAYLSVLTKRSR